MAIIIYEVIHHLQLLVSPQRTRDTTLGEATLTVLQLTEPLQHVKTVATNGGGNGRAVCYAYLKDGCHGYYHVNIDTGIASANEG